VQAAILGSTENIPALPWAPSITLATADDNLANGTDAVLFSEKPNRPLCSLAPEFDLYQAECELDNGREVFGATHKLDYVLGSGTNSYAYIVGRANSSSKRRLRGSRQSAGPDEP
jgi:hypothetical protein